MFRFVIFLLLSLFTILGLGVASEAAGPDWAKATKMAESLMDLDSVVGEKYDRKKHFGNGWIDADGDCQDTRQEVLITESLIPVTLTWDGCKVKGGLWYCKFTGLVYVEPSDVDIDHLVPLKAAWLAGADHWSQAERIAYANNLADPDHLIAVDDSTNQSKGARDPGQWLPQINKSWYIEAWWSVKNEYDMTFNAQEVRAMMDGVITDVE
jgi:hypothetical protein